jgi:hypothetical protein
LGSHHIPKNIPALEIDETGEMFLHMIQSGSLIEEQVLFDPSAPQGSIDVITALDHKIILKPNSEKSDLDREIGKGLTNSDISQTRAAIDTHSPTHIELLKKDYHDRSFAL